MKWANLKLKDLPEFFRLCQIKTEDLVELFDRDIKLLSIVTGNSEDSFNAMSPKEFAVYREKLMKFINDTPQSKYIASFRHQGRKYWLVPSANEATVDQLASIHQLHITPENYYQNLPYVVALFATEKKGFKLWRKKLTFSQKAEAFKELSADVGISISLFFCKVLPELEKAMVTSLEQQIKKQLKVIDKELRKVKRQSSADGGG